MLDLLVNDGIYLLALLGIPFLLGVIYFTAHRSSRAVQVWFHQREVMLHAPYGRMAFRMAAVLLLGIALVGISLGGRSERTISTYGREVYILLDVSASMMTEDVKPNRLEKVRREMKQMISSLSGDKFGLIVFTSDAYVQCPLTNDKDAMLLFLDMVNPSQFSNGGTDFRSALAMALDRFEHVEKESKKTSRCVLLVSDGEHFGDSYESVLDRMKLQDITVFTVGVGTEAGGPVPDYQGGQKVGVKRGQDGQTAISTIQESTLRSIAEVFGTTYLRMDEQMDNLDPIEDQIRMVSASQTGSRAEKMKHNWFQVPLGMAFVLILLSMILAPLRRPEANSLS
jgi:Ca-activated chloride channel family protein